jgi:methyl-accepting chemotaxis protein
VTEHKNKLATEIAEILGQIQGQDVLRQRIERAVLAVARRNDILRELPRTLAECDADLAGLPSRMKVVLDDYQVNEAVHAPAAAEAAGQAEGESKYELF